MGIDLTCLLAMKSRVSLGVLELHVGAFDDSGDLLELFISIFLVVLDDPREDFGQVLVQVGGHVVFVGVGLVQLLLDLVQRFRADTHIYLIL